MLKMHSRYRPIRKLRRSMKQDHDSLKSQEEIIATVFIQSSSQRRRKYSYEFNQTG